MDRLKDKTALVTGAGRGIGRAIAEAFAQEGAHVIATGRAQQSTFGDDVEWHQLEVSNEDHWKRVIAHAEASYGGVDVLVNNAGIITYDLPHEVSMADWSRVIAVNQTGTWLGMREVVPGMLGRGGGSIINVSSIWGNAAVAGAHAYHATKGAVRNMSKSAAITYAKDNIRVNSLHPGFIVTPLTDAQDPAINEHVVSQTPMGRAGQPEEIAQGAIFLASDESTFMTGAELVIDGGYLAQ